MKSLSIFLLTILSVTGCSLRQEARLTDQVTSNKAQPKSAAAFSGTPAQKTENYTLNQAEKVVSLDRAVDRKIIRDANLTIEVNSTSEAQQRITSIAELHGGFIMASEAKQHENSDPAKRNVDIKLVIRVPSTQFNSALDEIEKLASNVTQQNVSGQDVTEEFIDLDARTKTQKALELQFLEIMKQATKVADALEVQRQIAEVRTEIEKLEGRRRFLENRSSLSTITVNIQTPMPIVVSASGFGHTLREAVSESLDVASGIVLFFVRFVIVMTPVFVFVILPLIFVAIYFRRRAQRVRLANQLEATAVAD
jgi:hypothetical protein